MLARAGCGGRAFSASRPRAQGQDLEMPITCTLFANSAADWNMQLAATRVGGRKRCSGRPRLAEIQSGFSRASRSPALRRLAKLAPRTSARGQHSADRSRACELTTYALSERSERSLRSTPGDSRSGEPPRRKAAARAILRITKTQNEKNRRETTVRKQLFLINPPAPLRRQRTAESTNHADRSRNSYHSGCEVALGEDKGKK